MNKKNNLIVHLRVELFLILISEKLRFFWTVPEITIHNEINRLF